MNIGRACHAGESRMWACVLPETGSKGGAHPAAPAVAAIGEKAEYLLKISKKQFKAHRSYGIIKL